MDSFEINKIVAAVLLVALLIIGIGKLSNIIFYVEKPKTPGYAVEVEQVLPSSTSEIKEEEKVNLNHDYSKVYQFHRISVRTLC